MVLQAKSSVIVLLLFCLLSFSCSKNKGALDTVSVDVQALPMMHSERISSLISDSGMTRYRLKAEVWDVYSDNVKEPYWYFPKGIHVEQFDSLYNVEGSIVADTAYNYEKQKLWRLVGNVKVSNLQGEKFETSEMFWDQKQEKIYSEKFIRIEQGGRVYMGIGFQSNQDMTRWRIYSLQAEITVDEADSARNTPPRDPAHSQ